jgi:hypothetical protein
MKYSFLIIGLVLLFNSTQAQKKKSKDNPTWFNLELKGGGGTSFLFNKNISSDDTIKTGQLFNPSYGIGLGVHFTKGFAVQIEKCWSNFGQNYTYKNGFPAQNINLTASEWGLFIRKTGEGSGFVGIGFKASQLSKSSIDSTFGYFNKSLSFINFEFGGPLWLTNIFDININMRIGYGLNDIVSNKNYQPGEYKKYDSYKPTSPLLVQLMIGLNWHIGYFATSNCKHKGFLLFTN